MNWERELEGQREAPGASPAALARVRARLGAELVAAPDRSWRGEAIIALSVCWSVGLVFAIYLLSTHALEVGLVVRRAATISGLVLLSAGAVYAAIAPGQRSVRIVAVFAALSLAAALVLMRGHPAPATQPPWVCTVSHLAVGVLPLVVVLRALRRAAFDPLRAVVAGVFSGATGALVGELACAQDGRHVLVFHLGAWALVVLLAFVLSRVTKRVAYAP